MESFGLAAPIPRSLSDWFLHFRLETGRAKCLWAQSEAVVGPTTFTHRGPHTCEIPITCSEDPIGFGVAGFGFMDSYAHTHQNFNQILPHLEAIVLSVLTCYRFVEAYRFPLKQQKSLRHRFVYSYRFPCSAHADKLHQFYTKPNDPGDVQAHIS